MNRKFLFPIFAGVFLIALALFWKQEHPAEPEKAVTNFEECAEAGYPVMESYPRQCRTPDGKNFTEDTGAENCVSAADCKSGQACVEGSCR